MTSLAQTAMQTDSQQKVAETQAGVTREGQSIQSMIAANKLALEERQLEEIAIPDLKKNRPQ